MQKLIETDFVLKTENCQLPTAYLKRWILKKYLKKFVK